LETPHTSRGSPNRPPLSTDTGRGQLRASFSFSRWNQCPGHSEYPRGFSCQLRSSQPVASRASIHLSRTYSLRSSSKPMNTTVSDRGCSPPIRSIRCTSCSQRK